MIVTPVPIRLTVIRFQLAVIGVGAMIFRSHRAYGSRSAGPQV